MKQWDFARHIHIEVSPIQQEFFRGSLQWGISIPMLKLENVKKIHKIKVWWPILADDISGSGSQQVTNY